MREYGVPTDLDGVLPWSWAEERLVACRNYWLATVSSDGRPHALPVWGVWLREPDRFAFSCAPGSRKARNLRAVARATVAVDDTVECVSVEGRTREVSGEAREPAIAQYVAKYEQDPQKRTELGEFLRRNAVFEVTPERAFGIVERPDEFASRATRWVW